MIRNLSTRAIAIPLLTTLCFATPALARDHEVQMVNKGTAGFMTFEPAFIQVAPGDSVTFKPTNPSHNAESIETMLPTGANKFKGALNKPITVTFTKPGLYGYKCAPHLAMGMVGLVQVGNTADKATANVAAAKLPARAKGRMTALVNQAR